MYICNACGVTLPENASFCPNCGIEINEQNRGDAPVAMEPTARPNVPAEATDEIIDGAAAPKVKELAAPKKKKKWKLHAAHFLLTLPVVLVIAVAVLAAIAFNARPKSDVETRLELFHQGLAPLPVLCEDGAVRWGYVNKNGKYEIDPVFEDALNFDNNGLAPVKQNGKWGYIDKHGKFSIEPIYEQAAEFGTSEYAPVKLNGVWGYITKSGDLMINPQFDQAEPFSENGMALVKIGGKYGYINRKGVYVIEPRYQNARSFGLSGYAAVYVFEKWGMINKKGEYVINPQFDEMEPFANNDLALVQLGGKYGYIDRKGAYVVRPIYEEGYSFSENGLALVKQNGKYGYINAQGDFVIEPTYDRALSFHSESGYAAVCPNAEEGLWGYINYHGEYEIEPVFASAGTFHCDIAAVRDEQGFLYIDKNAETVYRPDAFCVGIGSCTDDGYAMIGYRNGEGDYGYAIIDKKGEIVVAFTRVLEGAVPIVHR